MPVIVIKKYANRRLYDTEASAYVTLNQVADMIRSGRQVKVVEAKTEADVTAFILSQIIVEQARDKNVLLPPALLHLIIRYGDNLLEGFFETYLEQMVSQYLAYRHTVDDQFRQWLEMGIQASKMTHRTLETLNPLHKIFASKPGKTSPGNDDNGT